MPYLPVRTKGFSIATAIAITTITKLTVAIIIIITTTNLIVAKLIISRHS